MDRLHEHSLYLHVFTNGKLYLLPSDQKRGVLSGLSRLKLELRRAEFLNGIVLYSLDSNLELQNPKAARVLTNLENCSAAVQMVDPHPEVNGYQRSFAPYLGEALEVAEFDVEGLRAHLRDARRASQEFRRGSAEFKQHQERCQKLAEKLANAKRCVERLSALYFELCVRPEDLN